MISVGYASYFPPQVNGCGDVTFNLIGGLDAKQYALTLYTTAKGVPAHPAIQAVAPLDELLDRARHGHDLLITTLSNGPDSEKYAAIVQRHGGVAHLHDGVINHMLAGMVVDGRLKRSEFLDVYERSYGRRERDLLDRLDGWWDSPIAKYFTGLGEVLPDAEAVVVNSDFLRRRVLSYTPSMPVGVIEQRYFDVPPRQRKAGGAKIIGTFGFVGAHKGLETIIDALPLIPASLPVEFHIVGEGSPLYFAALYVRARRLGVAHRVKIRAGLDQQQFLQVLADADVGIQLRDPTFGETSSVVQRLLYAGVPVVVSNTGSYADLPRIVRKVSVPHVVKEVAEALVAALEDHRDLTDDLELLGQRQYADRYFSLAAGLLAARRLASRAS